MSTEDRSTADGAVLIRLLTAADAALLKAVAESVFDEEAEAGLHDRALGCREEWVLTEEDNAAARGLYRAAGGEESKVVYFTFGLEAEDAT